MSARVLVVAKAPVAGQVKTRLGAEIGMAAAADVAAAALLDTMAACTAAFGPDGCLLSLAGDFADAVRGDELARAAEGWSIAPQRGVTFAERLANAHLDVPYGGPVVQVGMDTPQLTPELLVEVAAAVDEHDAVLGPAEDGGWWVLALRRPTGARSLHDVPMSTPTTYDDTRRALVGEGLDVVTAPTLRDVDTVADATAVAAEARDGEFARAWRGVRS
ncbi:TIGR04282 family arsenosugar biosynthesis glycosyltransferase [Nocardioides sp. URHA0020]|uniref:TIGR04282 family arsenosugar biosynthesis glycosyltransferase n=1 Tax=Nocardioides sp. URHA0020 TaxID=1380392 RepID=UPI00048A74B7|nr:DUF2064 domain-containing protein [Nocardioides sp. URHA0020]